MATWLARRTRLTVVVLLSVFFSSGAWLAGCTTAVVSGKATADGRPLLWKNRDADDLHNAVAFCADGRYAYLAVVNGGDALALEAWSGVNEKGFAIMNSASYNFGNDDTKAEGAFMRAALQSCANIEEFQALLVRTNESRRDVSANFGVIDAKGGAAYFETKDGSFQRFDAADAPRGLLVRSNYSHSGSPDQGTGYTRESRALELLNGLAKEGRLSAETLLATVGRDIANTPIGSDPDATWKAGGPAFAYIGDSISRQDTANAFLVHGVKAGEDPRLSTVWAILGLPVSGVAVPFWVGARSVPAEAAAGREHCPLNAAFAGIVSWLYPDQRGERRKYMQLDRWLDPGKGLRAPLAKREEENFRLAGAALESWRRQPPTGEGMAELQGRLARETLQAVQSLIKGKVAPPEQQNSRP